VQTEFPTDYPTWVRTVATDFNHGMPFFVTSHRIHMAGVPTLMLRTSTGEYVTAPANDAFGGDVSAVGSSLYIGGSSSNQELMGDIAEVIMIRGSVTLPAEAQIESYLKTKYRL
jgi:hypothetical protein